jgi:para-aminobenzoate synthetase component I
VSTTKKVYQLADNYSLLLSKLLQWGKHFTHFALYPGNNYNDPYHKFDLVFGAGAKRIISPQKNFLKNLEESWQTEPSWLFGYIGYDVKNEIEKLQSHNADDVQAPEIYFFEPEVIGFVKEGQLHLEAHNPDFIFDEIIRGCLLKDEKLPKLHFYSRFSRDTYEAHAESLKNHIQLGDIYEVNFCQEFFTKNAEIDPFLVFYRLNEKAHPPFAAFLNFPSHSVMCASPERYLQKDDQVLISQPIKGTAKRSKDEKEDLLLAQNLSASTKERAENVMIVDLVRNDLSRVARVGSVQVPELFGVHTFPTVHQLISTVQAELLTDKTWVVAILASFPMGSMTGAPKVRAMQLIEQYEQHKRGIYSGALGYITPQGNFDFNVVIRSLVYHKSSGYLSLSVGSALTILAETGQEYEECMLKAEAIINLFE